MCSSVIRVVWCCFFYDFISLHFVAHVPSAGTSVVPFAWCGHANMHSGQSWPMSFLMLHFWGLRNLFPHILLRVWWYCDATTWHNHQARIYGAPSTWWPTYYWPMTSIEFSVASSMVALLLTISFSWCPDVAVQHYMVAQYHVILVMLNFQWPQWWWPSFSPFLSVGAQMWPCSITWWPNIMLLWWC